MYFTIQTDTTGNTEITLNYLEKKIWHNASELIKNQII